MAKDLNNRALAVSQKIYGRLLLAYPPAHRAEYGPAMAQLFRDQCRDAWNESQGWGVTKLWLRVLPDLVNTSIMERLAALNERKTMSDKLASLFRFRQTTPLSMFFTVFVAVFLFVFMSSVVITFILPESYASTSRLKIEPDAWLTGASAYSDPDFLQTTFEILQSQLVLKPVIDKLNLNVAWGKKYANGEPLKTAESLEMLKARTSLAPVRNTKLIKITAYSEDKNEAAQIANVIAESYRDYRVNSQAELMTKRMSALRQEYQKQEAQISQMQSDLDALRQKLNLSDNDPEPSPAELQQRLEKKRDDGEQAYRKESVELEDLQKLSPDQLRDELPMVVSDSGLSELLSQLNLAERKLLTVKTNLSPQHPDVIQTQSLVDMLNKQVDSRINGIMGGLENLLKSRRAALDSFALFVVKVKTAQPYWDKKRDLAQLREFHNVLAIKIESERLDAQLPGSPAVEITDQAQPGRVPTRPNKPLNIALGAGLGILLALFVAGFAALLIKKRTGKIPATA
jgi:uncharacterized protein involved in exopolysaccharide biosynthesis